MSGAGGRATCPRCQTPVAAEVAPGGLCPACLLKLGLAEGGESPASPGRIGAYEIVRPLGEGGMGVVYLAEQREPLRRRVAVKVIKLGMDTREVVARFEGERQILAMMSHPSIARVFEAGATERGRPYFVMEYVEGERITDHCDREHATIPERLELFLQVCAAVQHAHQKGIIHRDLKPSNVLVEELDGEPTPKVIDFGVAKATGPGGPERTLLTRRGVWLGTPAYMSPEAAGRGAPEEVDSRTDIYALGVLLYELLCGCLPFDPDRLLRAGDEELRRILREEEPPPPSERARSLDAARAEEVAARRGADAAALRRRLRGDLDWIVMRALEKDRDRRYPSASELAADLRRHLAGRPVAAGPPSAAYRFGKLVRRHRLAVAAAGAVTLALLLGIVGTTAGLIEARAAERAARQEARRAQEVSDFMVGLFQVSDPGEARGNTVTAREILDQGARKIRAELREEPAVRARLLGTMGTVYRKLGLYDDAAPLLEESLRVEEGRAEAPPAELAEALRDLGTLEVERAKFERGRRLLERAVETLRRAPETDEASLAATLKELAVLDYRKGDLDAAEPLYRESLELARRALGPEDPLVAWDLNDLGNVARDREHYREAEDLFRRSMAIHEKAYGPDHPYVANNLNNLANAYHRQGAYERALPLRRRALAIYRKVLPPDHPLLGYGLTNLAVLYQDLGEYERAEVLYRKTLEGREKVLGPDHPDVAVDLYHLASLYRDRGDSERALPLYERALAVAEKAVGRDGYLVGVILASFADLDRETGDEARAEPLLRRAVGIFQATLRPGHSRISAARSDLAGLCARQRRYQEAEALFQEALAVQRSLHARDPESRRWRTDLAASLVGLGELQEARGEPAAARRAWSEAAELMAPVVAASDAPGFLEVHALALLHLRRAGEAGPAVQKLLATGRRNPDLLRLASRQGLI